MIAKRHRWRKPVGDMGTRFLFVNRSFACLAILTLLPLAACRGHAQLSPEAVRQELIQTGVEFNKESFLESARNGELQRVRLFLRAGMNPDETDEKGQVALMESASFNHVSTVQTLIAQGATVNLKDRDGLSALIHAAITSSGEALRVLADAGADLNAADNRGATALIYSALDGSYECAEALLERGADIEALDADGYTPLLLLIKHTKKSDVRSQSWTDVLLKIRMDRIRTLRILVEHGANVNATNKRGQTALTLAEENGVPEVIEVLKKAGAHI